MRKGKNQTWWMPTFPRQPAPSRWTQQESLASQEQREMRDLDLQRAWVSQMNISGHFARMKQNETEIIRWKNAPYSRGTDRCFLCMRFQGSIRSVSGHMFSLVSSSRSEGQNKGKNNTEYENASAELQLKCFVLGSSPRSGIEKQQQAEHLKNHPNAKLHAGRE